MSAKRATQRYYSVMAPAMAIYLGASFGIALFGDGLAIELIYLIALAPILAMLAMFWAHWRFISEIDEFLRSIHIRALIAGLAVMLIIATGWGYLEQYADAPVLSVFWLNPIFWIAYALSAVVSAGRDWKAVL